MKISVIGAGNVGGTAALRLAQENLGEIVLLDIAKGYAQGKAFDLEDCRRLVGVDYSLKGSDNIEDIANSQIIVVTAGLPRKPGMTREDLLNKNAAILKELCQKIKQAAPDCILIVVTNPLDIMTTFALKATGFSPKKVFGMGVSLDASRFANLAAKEFKLSPLDIDACVIGSHGEGMLPVPRLTKVKNTTLDKFASLEKIDELVKKTVGRGLEIVTLLGSGSAYFAPSAAITQIVRAIAKDEKRVIGVSAYLDGKYGVKDVCLGMPCRLGINGIEEIVPLELNADELEILVKSAERIKEQFNSITI